MLGSSAERVQARECVADLLERLLGLDQLLRAVANRADVHKHPEDALVHGLTPTHLAPVVVAARRELVGLLCPRLQLVAAALELQHAVLQHGQRPQESPIAGHSAHVPLHVLASDLWLVLVGRHHGLHDPRAPLLDGARLTLLGAYLCDGHGVDGNLSGHPELLERLHAELQCLLPVAVLLIARRGVVHHTSGQLRGVDPGRQRQRAREATGQQPLRAEGEDRRLLLQVPVAPVLGLVEEAAVLAGHEVLEGPVCRLGRLPSLGPGSLLSDVARSLLGHRWHLREARDIGRREERVDLLHLRFCPLLGVPQRALQSLGLRVRLAPRQP
mmetsp:Transcript_60797/g.156688  ORF Transcript_60797/g.156688 Transcript_60797/m.156688 type:complete len:328 (-) Transcript_60797:39-1022(-)